MRSLPFIGVEKNVEAVPVLHFSTPKIKHHKVTVDQTEPTKCRNKLTVKTQWELSVLFKP